MYAPGVCVQGQRGGVAYVGVMAFTTNLSGANRLVRGRDW